MNAATLKIFIIILILLQEIFGFDEHLQAIHKMDETGMSLEPALSRRGKRKYVRCQTLGHKQQTTSIGCGSATGNVILFIVAICCKTGQLQYLWMSNEVSVSRFAVSDNGWLDHELFSYFLTENFMEDAVPHHPLLLLLDHHCTNLSNKLFRWPNIVIFSLPPHTIRIC